MVRCVSALRVTLVTGGHPFDREAFSALFASVSGIELATREHPGARAWLEHPDGPCPEVMVFYDFAQQLGEDGRRNLESWIDAGMGVVVLHHAIHNFTEWPRFRQIVGGYWSVERVTIGATAYGPSTWCETIVPVRIADQGHPITTGIADFEIADECYGDYWIAPDAKPLLTTDHPKSQSMLGWTRRQGRGRVVYLQPGHGPDAYAHPSYRQLVGRAIAWAGRGDTD